MEKMEAGREFQFHEVMETNVLANAVVRHFSNLTPKECCESAKRVVHAKHALGELPILTHQSTCRDSIYNKGKAQRHFFDEQVKKRKRVEGVGEVRIVD